MMTTAAKTRTPLLLESTCGPEGVRIPLEPDGVVTLGRRPNCTVALPGYEQVSRQHAQISYDSGTCYVKDNRSRHGTWLNGVRIEPDRPYPIHSGDLIALSPYVVFRVVDPAAPSSTTMTVQAVDHAEADATSIVTVDTAAGADPSRQRLDLLLKVAQTIHAARTQEALAEAVVDAAMTGTCFTHAAFLGPMDAQGRITVLARRSRTRGGRAPGSAPGSAPRSAPGSAPGGTPGGAAGGGDQPQFSRSLIEQASRGQPARIQAVRSGVHAGPRQWRYWPATPVTEAHEAAPRPDSAPAGGQDGGFSQSIVTLGISEALCVPIMVGSTVAGHLYVDRRHGEGLASSSAQDGAEFAVGLGEVAALAMASLKRHELEQRFTRIEAELAAAAEAQSLVLPPHEGRFGRFSYIGESRPGRVVSGDFFDIFAIDDHRIVLTVGDVCGKGIGASVLMTAAQGFLRAAFARADDPAKVIAELAEYLRPRCAAHAFITLWAAVVDDQTGRFRYVDAGHGYGLHLRADGRLEHLREAGGLPVGVPVEWGYEAATGQLRRGDRLIVVSDGIIEQPGPGGQAESTQFGLDRLIALAPQLITAEDEVATLFRAVQQHAARNILDDDATALVLRWRDDER